jgi:tetratricopeptide (TPR) repeat protein
MPKKNNLTGQSRAAQVSPASAPALAEARGPESAGRYEKVPGQSFRAAYALLPVAIAIIVSINTLWNGFAADDSLQILRNEYVKSFSNLPRAFTTSIWSFATEDINFAVSSYYRPFLNVLFTINYALFGQTAWAWHLVSVLLHAGVTFLVFAVISELTGQRRIGLLTAALFAAHPTHAEAVAWLASATELLLALFLLSSYYAYLRYRKTESFPLAAVSLLLYLLALLNKETALAMPLVVIYTEYYLRAGPISGRRLLLVAIKRAALFLIPTLIYLLMRYNALDALLSDQIARHSLAHIILTAPLAVAKYLKLMILPAGYSYQHYTAVVETPLSLSFIAPLALILALGVGVWKSRERALKFAALWFITLLAPPLFGIRHFDPEYLVQERYLYLPSVGFCLAVALAINWLAEGRGAVRGKVTATIAAVLIITVWGVAHFLHNRAWRDTLTICKNSVAVAPDSARAHAALARAYMDAGWVKEGEAQAEVALSFGPDSPVAYLASSYVAFRLGRINEAIEILETALQQLEMRPSNKKEITTIHLNLGQLYMRRAEAAGPAAPRQARADDTARAEQHLTRTMEIEPRPVASHALADLYFRTRRFDESLAMFKRTQEHVPEWFASIHVNLGRTYEEMKQPQQAIAEFRKYLELALPGTPVRKDVEDYLQKLERRAN